MEELDECFMLPSVRFMLQILIFYVNLTNGKTDNQTDRQAVLPIKGVQSSLSKNGSAIMGLTKAPNP